MKNPEKIIECEAENLYPEHFGIKAHRYMYMAILYLFSKNTKPTPMSIIEVLTDKTAKQELENIGGLDYLNTLTEANFEENNLKIFCMKVKQASTRRTIYQICKETQEEMLSEKSEVLNPEELTALLENKIIDLSIKNTNTNDVYKMGSTLNEKLEKRANSPMKVAGIETGWPQFDNYTNGAKPSDLIILCARAKTGKSAALTNWANNISIKDQIPILYIDTEMPSDEQEDRLLAINSEIPEKEITNGLYVIDTANGTAKEKIKKIHQAKKLIQDGFFFHVYMPHFTIEKVTALARKYQIQHGIKALFFDYIKFPSNQVNNLKTMQEWQALGFFTSGLKDLAGILQIPVFTAAQENRSNPKSKEKDETNVAGSDRILQYATKLIFLYNKSDEDIAREGIINGNQQLYIAFQRHGQSDCPPINILFNRPILKQKEV